MNPIISVRGVLPMVRQRKNMMENTMTIVALKVFLQTQMIHPKKSTLNFLDEICLKTPSYHSWQQEVWLVHCNEPCQFIAYADSEMLKPIWDEVKADIEENGYPVELIQDHLSIDGDLTGYLFQCIHCQQHRLHIDCS